MKGTKAIAAMLVVAGLAVWAWKTNNQKTEPPKPKVAERVVDPKAKEVLDRAITATSNAKAFRYTAKFVSSDPIPDVSGRVWADQEKHRQGLSMTQEAPEPKSYDASTDGERVYLASHADKRFTHGTYPATARLLRVGYDLMLSELGDATPFKKELKGSLRYDGRQDVEGVACDVVYVEYRRKGSHARWFFGDDGLPRKVEYFYNMYPDIPEDQRSKEVLTLSNLELNPVFTDADFRLTRPEDYADNEIKPPEPLLAVGEAAPEWERKTPGGKNISLASLRGQVVVLDFWATWCGPCKMAMPGLQKLHEQYSGRGVNVVGVNCQETDKNPGAFMEQNDFTYPVALEGDAVADAYHVSGLPTFYVIDQQGQIAFSGVGYSEESEAKLAELVKSLVEAGDVADTETGS